MKTTQYNEYQSDVPESDDEKTSIIKEMMADVAALDPQRVKAFAIIIMEGPNADDPPEDIYLTRNIAGTGPDKTVMFQHFVEYMKAFHENCDRDAPPIQ